MKITGRLVRSLLLKIVEDASATRRVVERMEAREQAPRGLGRPDGRCDAQNPLGRGRCTRPAPHDGLHCDATAMTTWPVPPDPQRNAHQRDPHNQVMLEVRVVARDAEQWWGPGCRILTADGRDITTLVPVDYAADLERSYRRPQPIEVDLFVRDADGQVMLTDDRKAIRRQRVTLLVTGFDRASG